MNTVLELRSLTKHYPTHRAVNGISLEIEQGEFFSLLGPSGCGKTTTLRLIAGFESPTSGEIFLKGKPLAGVPPYRRNVSTVFQSYALFPHLTVARNVAFGLEQRKRSRNAIASEVNRVLEMMQLDGKQDRLPSQISGGERQRVALARSLVLEPDVLLLDEPLSALDPKLRKAMRAELKSVQRRVGVTFLFITHDQEEAMALSDRMAVMQGGQLEQVGAPRELYIRPASPFVAEFLGPVNWLDGVGVRPESVRLYRDAVSPRLRGRVETTSYLGDAVLVEVRLEQGGCCTAKLLPVEADYAPGDFVAVDWDTSEELPVASHDQNSVAV